jgi:hypothetical protein
MHFHWPPVALCIFTLHCLILHIYGHAHTYMHLMYSAGAPLPYPDEVDVRPGSLTGHKMAAIGTKVHTFPRMYAYV